MKAWMVLATGLLVGAAQAQTVQIPLGQQGDPSVETPERGVSMSQVAKQFGQPSKIQPAVGDPPIATWHYSDFRVYFEHDKVIHSVRNPVSGAER